MKTICVLVVLLFTSSSCDEILNLSLSRENCLTRNSWKMKHFVNLSTNENYEISDGVLTFYDDGSLIINQGDTIRSESTWQLFDNEKYLRIGLNQYRARTISTKVMMLEYGQNEIVYIPF